MARRGEIYMRSRRRGRQESSPAGITVLVWLILLAAGVPASRAADDPPPVSRDSRLQVELFAADPDIVTPTGLDVDHAGRVFAIESNTHFPPEGYSRHGSDRVLVLQDIDGDGAAERPKVFADGFVHAMSIAVRTSFESQVPDTVLVATRKEVVALWDDDGDLVADRRRRILHLDTPGNYPHNGLAGFAFDAQGFMYIGLGENLGADYKLIGSDKVTWAGGGEGGSIFRCRLDGTKLVRFATGFWNPHANCVDTFGRIFSVDNDPDSLPPCRLIHIVQGGDYGYRFRNGRKGFHPFTSWNGEIPGTLPMMAGTGEAPSGIVAYESDGLPSEYIGNLLVTSWGDHRIDRFRLVEKGASFESVAEPMIQGGVHFRPVGLAVGPDGSLFCTDWVLRDYKVHGRGRVWRISRRPARKDQPHRQVVDVASVTAQRGVGELARLVESPRLALRRSAARALAGTPMGRGRLRQMVADHALGLRSRVEVLWAMARVDPADEDFGFLRPGKERARLAGGSSEVEIAAIELIGTPQFPFDASKRNFLKDDDVAALLWAPDPVDLPVATPGHRARWAAAAMRLLDVEQAIAFLAPGDPFLMGAALRRVTADDVTGPQLLQAVRHGLTVATNDARRQQTIRTLLVLAILKKFPNPVLTRQMLAGGQVDPVARRLVVQWVAETGQKGLRDHVAAVLSDSDITAELFHTTLAALDMLDGGDPKKIDNTPPAALAVPLLKDSDRPASVRSLALQMVDPSDKALDQPLFEALLASNTPRLVAETVRTLGLSKRPFAAELLLKTAADVMKPIAVRADAIAGLGRNTQVPAVAGALRRFAGGGELAIRVEAVRSLRPTLKADTSSQATFTELVASVTKTENPTRADRLWADQLATSLTLAGRPVPDALQALAGNRPKGIDALANAVKQGGSVPAGRRLFFHASGPQCGRCHVVNGRGRRVGPDLSLIARSRNRRQLLESILDPSREVAPQFTSWTLVTTDGRVLNGVIVYENRDRLTIEGADGKQTNLANTDVEFRTPQKKSLMPDKLVHQVTLEGLRDLLAYLESLK